MSGYLSTDRNIKGILTSTGVARDAGQIAIPISTKDPKISVNVTPVRRSVSRERPMQRSM